MRRVTLWLSLALSLSFSSLSLSGCASLQMVPPEAPSLYDTVFSSSVNIRSEAGSFRDSFQGSGTYLELGGVPYVLTALHVAELVDNSEDPPRVACHTPDYRNPLSEECVTILEGEVDVVPGFDIALMRLAAPLTTAHSAEMVPEYLWSLGESLLTSGWPNGCYALNPGQITGARASNAILTDTPYWFGISGGGVFNSEGVLIGVAYSLDATMLPTGDWAVVEGNKHFTLIPSTLLPLPK